MSLFSDIWGQINHSNVLFKITCCLEWKKEKKKKKDKYINRIRGKAEQEHGVKLKLSLRGNKRKGSVRHLWLFFHATVNNKALSYLLPLRTSITSKSDDLQGGSGYRITLPLAQQSMLCNLSLFNPQQARMLLVSTR